MDSIRMKCAWPSPLTSVKQAAAYLQVSEEKVRRLIRLGKLKAAKVGAHWRIPLEALASYIEENMS